ncbi:MAG: hypothetical protein WC732_07385 [Candidatus Omnitrophota bacterium]
MKIQILNAQEKLFEGVISMAVLPACGGEISLMDYHEPIFVALKQGFIRLVPLARRIGFGHRGEAGGRHGEIHEMKPFKIQRGVARFAGNNELVILVE